MPTLLETQKYYDQLKAHDWYSEYSDDPKVWRKGAEEAAVLRAKASISQEFKDLYQAFFHHAYSGPAFGTEKAALPGRPE